MIPQPKCHECEKPVYSDAEIEDCLCNRCADRLIQHANERAEWHFYHSEDSK